MDENTPLSLLEYYQLGYFSLSHLLTYVDFMTDFILRNFTHELKYTVQNKMDEFHPVYREELDVLCQLTDEMLTKNSRKIIIKRMLTILSRASLMKKSDPKGDCIIIDNLQHSITQGEPILQSLSFRKFEKDDQWEMKSVFIDRSYENHSIPGNFNRVRENLKRVIPDSIASYDSKFSTSNCISADENWIKKMLDGIESLDSSFSAKCSIRAGGNENMKKEMLDIIGHNSNFTIEGCIRADENSNMKRMPDSMEGYDSSFSAKGCIHGGGSGNIKEMPESIEGYGSSFSATGSIHGGGSGNIKEMSESIDFSATGCIHGGGSGNIKEMADSREGYGSSFSTNDSINVSEDGNSNIKSERNASSEYTANNKHLSHTFSGARKKRHYKSGACTRKFVSCNRKMPPLKVDTNLSSGDDDTFSHFSLIDLMNYDMDLMLSNDLKNYATTLKFRLLGRISEFQLDEEKELKVLCTLLDDDLSDSTRKKICLRICVFVNKTFSDELYNCKTRMKIRRYHQRANS